MDEEYLYIADSEGVAVSLFDWIATLSRGEEQPVESVLLQSASIVAAVHDIQVRRDEEESAIEMERQDVMQRRTVAVVAAPM